MKRKQKVNPDMLKQKRAELNSYLAEFDSAVGMLTDTMDNLSSINTLIDEKVAEIESYESELASTKNSLQTARTRNERVIKNFHALLEID